MGKKFKPGVNRNFSNKPQKETPDNQASGHMGVSMKSKKIKKQKKLNNAGKIKEPALESVPITDQAAVKKIKKLKTGHESTEHKTGIETNGNTTEAVVSKKLQKYNEPSGDKWDHREKVSQKKHKKKKNKTTEVEGEPTVHNEGKGTDDPEKVKKEKRKALNVETDDNDKQKKLKKTKDLDVAGKGNGSEIVSKKQKDFAAESKIEVSSEKPHKKHNKKNKQKNQSNGTNAEAHQSKTTESEIKNKRNQQKAKAIEADKDVVTSESESEDENNDTSNDMDRVNQNILKQHSNVDEEESSEDEQAEESPKDKDAKSDKKEKRFPGPEHSIFIGNLPNTAKKSTMKSLFKPYGKILTIRFRSSDGVTLFKKKDRKEAKALNCYVRFETRKEAEAACAMNGQLVEGNRIRVTIHTQKQMGHVTSTVFVGNINHKTTDNELYDFFSRVGDIEYVRQIADKGIGYVCFKKGVSIAKALKLNQQLLNGRPLRILKFDPTKQNKRKNKKGNLVNKANSFRPGRNNADKPGQGKDQQLGGQKPKQPVREFHGAVARLENKHKHKKKGGADKKKKLLAQKLTAAGVGRKK